MITGALKHLFTELPSINTAIAVWRMPLRRSMGLIYGTGYLYLVLAPFTKQKNETKPRLLLIV
jgi:hypothetical protein